MLTTIVVDNEYSSAAFEYRITAAIVHKATEDFKKTIYKMFNINAITGLTAQRMNTFLIEMSSTLRATFKEQISLEATLCEAYLNKINAADRSMSFDQSTRGVQYASFFVAPEQRYKEGEIKVDKGEVQKCISQLKEGPVKDVQEHIGHVERINFDISRGAVKDQNILVRDKAIESLRALLEIFNAFISSIEAVTSELLEADKTIARQMATGLIQPYKFQHASGFPK
jgi:hypothetical protein